MDLNVKFEYRKEENNPSDGEEVGNGAAGSFTFTGIGGSDAFIEGPTDEFAYTNARPVEPCDEWEYIPGTGWGQELQVSVETPGTENAKQVDPEDADYDPETGSDGSGIYDPPPPEDPSGGLVDRGSSAAGMGFGDTERASGQSGPLDEVAAKVEEQARKLMGYATGLGMPAPASTTGMPGVGTAASGLPGIPGVGTAAVAGLTNAPTVQTGAGQVAGVARAREGTEVDLTKRGDTPGGSMPQFPGY